MRASWARSGAGLNGLCRMTMSWRAASSRASTLRSAVARIAGIGRPRSSRSAPDGGDPVALVEVIVGDDEVGRAEVRQRGARLGEALRGGDDATPAAEQRPHAVEHASLVVDRQNPEAAQRLVGG